MADIRNISMRESDINLDLRVSRKEYEMLDRNTRNLMLVSTDPDSMRYSLTTGTLGNSNRIMLPKKVVGREKIGALQKKVPAQVFNLNGDIFLLIKLKRSEYGIPKFRE